MTELSTNTIVSLINTTNSSGTVVLPKTSDIPYRTVLFKDLYGRFNTNSFTVNTQSPDVFEDGTNSKTLNDNYSFLTLYANTNDSKWVVLNGTQLDSITVSTLNNVQTANISSISCDNIFLEGDKSKIRFYDASLDLSGSLYFSTGALYTQALAVDVGILTELLLANSLTVNTVAANATSNINFNGNINLNNNNLLAGNIISSSNVEATSISTLNFQATNFITSNTVTRSVSTFNVSTANIFANFISSPNASISNINLQRITGQVFTANFFPTSINAVVGNANLPYQQGGYRQVFTSSITGLTGAGANTVSVIGSLSTQNISVSTLANVSLITTSNIATRRISRPPGMGGQIPIDSLDPATNTGTQIGFLQANNSGGRFAGMFMFSTFTNTIIPTTPNGFIGSTVTVLNTLSSQNTVVSSIRGAAGLSIGALSSNISIFTNSGSINIAPTNGNININSSLFPFPNTNYSLGGVGRERFNQINAVSTNTSIISAGGGDNSIGSTVRVLGTLSSQNMVVSTIRGADGLNVLTQNGNLTFNTINGGIQFTASNGSINIGSSIFPFSSANPTLSLGGAGLFLFAQTNSISTNTSIITPANGANSIGSTVRVLGTLSSQNSVISSVTISNATIFNLSSFFYNGIEKYNYISTNSVPSTIIGLGTFGYLSSFNSVSSLNISTGSLFANTVSSTRLFTSSVNTNSLITNTIYIGQSNNFGALSYDSNTNKISVSKDINLNQNSISSINQIQVNESFFGIPDTTEFKKFRYFNNYFSYTNDDVSFIPIASEWSFFPAQNTVDLANNELTNVNQTIVSNSAATNTIARRLYFDINTSFSIDNVTFSNVLDTVPLTYPSFMNPNSFYTYLNCTFSFRCDDVKDDLAYYFALSNKSQGIEYAGEIFSSSYPYLENEHLILSSNRSISVQDQFNISSWGDGDQFIPMMYVKANNLSHTMNNMKFSMVYEPLIEFL